MDKLQSARQIINETDKEIALLFEKRMAAVRSIAQYKKENSLPVTDAKREDDVIRHNAEYIRDEEIKEYYEKFIRNTIDLSVAYQQKIMKD